MASDFQKIIYSAHETQGFLFAPATKKNVKSHIRQYILFCVHFKRTIPPAQRETLVAFFELYSVTASYEHLKNVYSSLKFLHKAMNLPFLEDEFQVNTILPKCHFRFYQSLQKFCLIYMASLIFLNLRILPYGVLFLWHFTAFFVRQMLPQSR